MAENEVLDVGNRRHYRHWRAALADPKLTATEIGECLSQDLMLRLRSALRGPPLYLILKACGQDRETLQAAITSYKDRTLAKFVENACAITKSNDVYVIAKKIADLIVDGVVDRSSLYAGRYEHHANSVSHEALERESSARLEACKPEIVGLIVASLNARPIARARIATKRHTGKSMVETSLRQAQ